MLASLPIGRGLSSFTRQVAAANGLRSTSIYFGHLLRVLGYLWGASSQGLFYAHDNRLQLHSYSNSTWVSEPIDRRSIT